MFESGDLCGEPLRQQRRGRTDQSGRMYKEHITCGEVGKKVSTVVTPWSTHSYLPPPGGATGGGGGALRSSSSSWLWGRVLCWPLLPLCSELLFLFLLPPLDMATACRLFLHPPPPSVPPHLHLFTSHFTGSILFIKVHRRFSNFTHHDMF